MSYVTKITNDELVNLKSLLDYDPITGIFVWKKWQKHGVSRSEVAGTSGYWRYVRIKVCQRSWAAHWLAWYFVNGSDGVNSRMEIDHINGISIDNRIENLRLVDRKTNSQNIVKARSRSRSGLLGVRFDGRKKKCWYASVCRDGITKFLGHFKTPIEAHAAYVAFRAAEEPAAAIHIERSRLSQPSRQSISTVNPLAVFSV